MANINLTADNIQVRASSIEENRAILQEIQAKKEVDTRKQDELSTLFDEINAQCCASESLRENRKISALTLFDKIENILQPVCYGPLPGCLPGKWWAIRMDCSRDYVHEPVNENIHDGPYGAVSICTPHLNLYNDIDLGNVLTFTSREYCASNKSVDDSLVLSYKNQIPIRLVRSYCCSSKYAPRTGYRYDGLYTVVHHWIGVSADTKKHHKFVLIRVLNQEPPPWTSKKINFKTARLRKSSSRLTRSHSNVGDQESKAVKFVYNKVEKQSKPSSVITIVSRQVFDKCTSNSLDSSLKLTINPDSLNQSLCANSCSTKLCSTNLSIRTNLYDSSHQAQDAKKSVTSTCKIFKPNQFVQQSQASLKELEQLSTGSSSKHQVESEISTSTRSIISERKVKKVTWADACNAGLIRMEKTIPMAGNSYQYSSSSTIDGFSSKSRKKGCIMKYNSTADYCSTSKMAKHKKTISTKSSDHISQGHSKVSQNSKANFSTVHELLHETEKASESTSIDSLAPDELVSVIVKEKYHPMAKLLIGNMIGLENQEAAIVNAYNALTKVNQDESKQSKTNKLRNKFSIKSPSKKNGILKKQRREIANLTIDAKFDTRSSRSRGLGTSNKRILKPETTRRKLLNTRKMQLRNKNISSRENNSKILEKSKKVQSTVAKVQQMVTVWTQCSLLAVPTVDQCQQTEDSLTSPPDVKVETVELVDLDDFKSEIRNVNSLPCSDPTTSYSKTKGVFSNYHGSAFAAVSAESNDRIARLRSIGFRPIRCVSQTKDEESGDESFKQDVNQEYNKYTSEENDIVGYMDEQLHFEDIEEEGKEEKPIDEDKISLQASSNILPQPIETLTEHDFNKPWHGWRKITINGQTYWTGC
ncbi:uncharacterized protein LOC131671381 [Phymastichus coffea]|uniref:uncharacterized protein LOC131671381 n=1 Tax=Phymastichus coffea TaxID=108790 RepID=UPI00273AF429|nr:uncharacterized protein LOC131671381 [Phymastichus coffea]